MPFLIKALDDAKKAPNFELPTSANKLGKGNDAASVASKRESGFTQTDAVEWKWVNTGVRELLSSVKKTWPESAERHSKPLVAFLQSRLIPSS